MKMSEYGKKKMSEARMSKANKISLKKVNHSKRTIRNN